MKKHLSAIALICCMQPAIAGFIDHGIYLADTTSGLDWLDLTPSTNRSYADVLAQLAPGGDLSGWRYATATEVGELVTHWTGVTVPLYGRVTVPEGSQSIDGLVEALGSTLDSASLITAGMTWDALHGYSEGSGQDYTYGYVSDSIESRQFISFLVDDDRPVGGAGSDFVDLHGGDGGVQNPAILSVGSFLVRSTQTQVPEPSSMALVVIALATLWRAHRRNGTTD